jgi:hypothetical protein
MGLWASCTFSYPRRAILLVTILFHIPVFRQEYRRHHKAILSLSLSRHLSPKEVPDDLLGDDLPDSSWIGGSQLHNHIPMHSGSIFLGQDYTWYMVSPAVYRLDGRSSS